MHSERAKELRYFSCSVLDEEMVHGLEESLLNLTEERDQLKTSLLNLTKKRDQLNTSLLTMTEERDQLKTSLSQNSERLINYSQIAKRCP